MLWSYASGPKHDHFHVFSCIVSKERAEEMCKVVQGRTAGDSSHLLTRYFISFAGSLQSCIILMMLKKEVKLLFQLQMLKIIIIRYRLFDTTYYLTL